ncbi:MAG: bacterioferritin-associated ferredoxin [Novosphingobium sp.]
MYLCICNAIREDDFRQLARRCTGSAEDIYAKLGKTPICGQCLDEAEDLLHAIRETDALLERVLAG